MKPLAIINFHRENVSALAYCGGNSSFFSRSSSSTGSRETTGLFQNGAFHNFFASGSNDCTIALWDLYAMNNTAS